MLPLCYNYVIIRDSPTDNVSDLTGLYCNKVVLFYARMPGQQMPGQVSNYRIILWAQFGELTVPSPKLLGPVLSDKYSAGVMNIR